MKEMSKEDDKLKSFIASEIAPLYELWVVNARLNEVEAKVLYYKLFDPDTPTTQLIAMLMTYDESSIRRIWRKVKKKIYKILP